MNSSPILNAVVSRLIAERDEALVQLDLIVNKNKFKGGLDSAVDEATETIKTLSNVEMAIETVKGIIQENLEREKAANNSTQKGRKK
jgi:hypothetical protein